MIAYVGELKPSGVTDRIGDAIHGLFRWVEENDYAGYDTFDGLSSHFLRPLTFNNRFLKIALQQGVRRFPVNLRPILGIPKCRSTKAMGFFARGFIRLHEATRDPVWREKAEFALQWLIDNTSPGYSGACWGNHFDYQSRVSYAPKRLPSVVWTAHIGHAFLDAYNHFRERGFLEVAISSCEHILNDLQHFAIGDALCIDYFPGSTSKVHNANTLGASLLARTYALTGKEAYRSLAEKAMRYTAESQRPDGSWYYGEAENLHWVDNFHSAYVLDCFKCYTLSTDDRQFENIMLSGYEYWKNTFFLADGTPRYYDRKTLPLDIQCCSQAIDTLVFFNDVDPQNVSLAVKIAEWTIRNMQDHTGYFYYRRYTPWLVNKTPTLHWGQATMFCALSGLYQVLSGRNRV